MKNEIITLKNPSFDKVRVKLIDCSFIPNESINAYVSSSESEFNRLWFSENPSCILPVVPHLARGNRVLIQLEPDSGNVLSFISMRIMAVFDKMPGLKEGYAFVTFTGEKINLTVINE